MLLVLLIGCTGREDCEAFDLGEDCEPAEICCQVVSGDMRCAYVTLDNTQFECLSSIDCTGAAEELRCEICDVGPEPAPGCE